MSLAGIDDEHTRFTVFKVKAGIKLLEIFRNTKSNSNDPDPQSKPFSNAMQRLRSYFGSGSDVMLMRRKLALMAQRPDETDLAYISRVGSTARLCGFDNGKEFEEIVATIAEHARHKEVRTTALKMLSKNGCFTDLIDKVREIESIRLNEEYVMRKQGRSDSVSVAAITTPYHSQRKYSERFQGRNKPYQRSVQKPRGGWKAHRGGHFSNNEKNQSRVRCWRCDSVFHSSDECYTRDKVCNNCGIKGHIRRACPAGFEGGDMRRMTTRDEPHTIAILEKTEEDTTEIDKVLPGTALADFGNAQLKLIANDDKVIVNDQPSLDNIRSSISQNIKSLHRTQAASSDIDDGYINAKVAGMNFVFLIDSGAQVNTFTEQMFRKLIATPQSSDEVFNVQNSADHPLKAYATEKSIEVLATFEAYLSITEDRPILLEKFYVVRESRALLNGMDTTFCSSMLVVPKGKDDIRLVVDLRGPNRYIFRTPFAMPTLEKILAELNGAKWFSTIHLSNAFFHMELDEESRHLTNFYTEFGMFRCVRLPFGLCNAPDLFQEALQRKVLEGCKGCKNYLDDVLVFGNTKEEHDENLAVVLAQLENHNVKLNNSKCTFGTQKAEFLGFTLTPDGWRINEEKVAAIKHFRRPSTCSEVKSFLGLVTFIDKFIPHRATKTECLRRLATSDSFYWTDNEESEFEYIKEEALTSIKLLGYYNINDRTEVFVDASPIGLGAVLIQLNAEGTPRIIACASKVLTTAEQKYPHTQKEALAVVWAVEKFSFYLLAKSFVVRTDAEANQFIFNSNHRLGKERCHEQRVVHCGASRMTSQLNVFQGARISQMP
ncbi:uncharacterized protein LOC134206005 [Armigeres subalbatus]|uniref:uncharacterized protein LOC134206005 n=1 Tax=Armigeres subalbatus TaxID=124917 RepID=UPI002ED12728